ncbi:MAG: hypothetical protein Tsb0020_45760 [Haliangiales bacterium]
MNLASLQARWRGSAVVGIPIAIGVALAIAAITRIPQATPRAATVTPRAPLARATSASQCASCHPRQSAEWRRSVMAHSVKSPLFQALEILIEEQAGRSFDCPHGAGILRDADPATACREPNSGLAITGAGGPRWCINCHAPGDSLQRAVPPWDGFTAQTSARAPLRDLLPEEAMEGISCVVCHQVSGPVAPGHERVGRYEGNPAWRSFVTGQRFSMRPEDGEGRFGIANSGFGLDPAALLRASPAEVIPGSAHGRPSDETRAYLRSSEFCGSCHDVRLFGTDVLGVADGEHFKRLRNAYSEWREWASGVRARGGEPASCQDCHMSVYPGVCVADEAPAAEATSAPRAPAVTVATTELADDACPPGTRFSPRPPGSYALGRAAVGSPLTPTTSHYFSGVDIPLDIDLSSGYSDDHSLDGAGLPLGAQQRRDLLLARALRLSVGVVEVGAGGLVVPLTIENVGAGHRIPAGFSQEREIWVHLRVTDGAGRLVYEVGRVDRADQDLPDKRFLRIGSRDDRVDRAGQPLGLFGADVADGPDAPRWSPDPGRGGTEFRGRGLINFQNGFLRCVRCIGVIDGAGRCQPGPGQRGHRAARYEDGDYDLDTGVCESNLRGREALFEVYFPVGALDASRGVVKGPDAIIDTRSLAPGVPVRYRYELPRVGHAGPYVIEARLLFRAFPPYLVRAFADYEAYAAARGRRPSGPLVSHDMLARLEIVELAAARVETR